MTVPMGSRGVLTKKANRTYRKILEDPAAMVAGASPFGDMRTSGLPILAVEDTQGG